MEPLALMEFLNAYAEGIRSAGLALSAVVAALTFVWKSRLEQRARERQIYSDLDDKYFRIHELILAHPKLDVSWYRDEPNVPLTRDEQHQQDVMYELITRLFERAYLTFGYASWGHRRRQWRGWVDYIEDYCRKQSYRQWWQKENWPLRTYRPGESTQFDRSFEAFMSRALKATQPRS
jgi:hypothetical protein